MFRLVTKMHRYIYFLFQNSVDYSSGNIDDFRILKTVKFSDDLHQDLEGDLVAVSDSNLLELHLRWEDDDEYRNIYILI